MYNVIGSLMLANWVDRTGTDGRNGRGNDGGNDDDGEGFDHDATMLLQCDV